MGVHVIKRFMKYFSIVLVLAITALLVWSRFNPGIGLGGNYRLIDVRPDNVHILKGDNIVVLPTIVDYHESSNFVAGMRFPVKFLQCENGSTALIRIVNKRRFFLFNKKDGLLKSFDNNQAFEAELVELDDIDFSLFDYSKFNVIWEKYSKLYANSTVSNCKPYPKGTKEYGASEKD